MAAINTDADNLYVTLSARRLRPDLFIVARARVDAAEAKLRQAGADRVVNPQCIGGTRMAALVDQPHVADFLDVVMHDGGLEFRLEEVTVIGDVAGGRADPARRPPPRRHRRAGAGHARCRTASSAPTRRRTRSIEPGEVLIAIGTATQLKGLADLVGRAGR